MTSIKPKPQHFALFKLHIAKGSSMDLCKLRSQALNSQSMNLISERSLFEKLHWLNTQFSYSPFGKWCLRKITLSKLLSDVYSPFGYKVAYASCNQTYIRFLQLQLLLQEPLNIQPLTKPFNPCIRWQMLTIHSKTMTAACIHVKLCVVFSANPLRI